MKRGPKPKSLQDRLANNSEWVNDCLMWVGAVRSDGYGAIRVLIDDKYKTLAAHRATWISKYGNIPDNMWVLHECNVKLCINVEHLYLGTRSDNELDKVAAGTSTFQLLPWTDQWQRNKKLKD